MKNKIRLDVAVFEAGYAESREKARAMIMAGEVRVNGQRVDKPGTKISTDAEITVKSKPRFVSRGGEKLAGALAAFNLDVAGLVCADVGASTGGFTDCLLQNGANKVYAIDVGYGQLAHKLRIHEQVVMLERTNARYLTTLGEEVDLVVIDASFISLRLLLPTIKNWLKQNAYVLPLIKPQFEAGKKDVGKGGVVRDHSVHYRVIEDTLQFAEAQGFSLLDLTLSPIKGPAGNIEFLTLLGYGVNQPETSNIAQLINNLTSLS